MPYSLLYKDPIQVHAWMKSNTKTSLKIVCGDLPDTHSSDQNTFIQQKLYAQEKLNLQADAASYSAMMISVPVLMAGPPKTGSMAVSGLA